MKKIIYLICWFMLYSCKTGIEENPLSNEPIIYTNTENQNLNISIFLDLSDRISPEEHPNRTMDYYKRDLGYINSIAKYFKAHILSKKITLLNDRMQLFVDPSPANDSINNIIQELKIYLNKENTTIEKINEIDELYERLSERLYNLAIEDHDYVGSDIWGFFKNKINDYCISPAHRNIFIVITDGYIFHEDNIITKGNKSNFLTSKKISQLGLKKSTWETEYKNKECGFLVDNENLKSLEVLVLGLNGYEQTPFEEGVIRQYWTDWLMGMKVDSFELKDADLPIHLNEVIHNFLRAD